MSSFFYLAFTINGMKATGENWQLREKPVPVPLCPPQISHGLDLGSNPGLHGELLRLGETADTTNFIYNAKMNNVSRQSMIV
jgi:hypothetical protein